MAWKSPDFCYASVCAHCNCLLVCCIICMCVFPCAVLEVSVLFTKPATLGMNILFSASPVCVCRRWELFAPRGLSVHAGRSGHRPGASESPPWCFERDGHWRLSSSLPGRAAPVPGVHPDRTAIHHHGMKIRLRPCQKPFPLLCIKDCC